MPFVQGCAGCFRLGDTMKKIPSGIFSRYMSAPKKTRLNDYLKGLRETVTKEPEKIKTLSMEVLHKYYLAPYQEEKDFYQQFYQRFSENNTTGLPHR